MNQAISENELDNFLARAKDSLEYLFNSARSKDELGFIFAILGINSGVEDVGWQPINETLKLTEDFTSLANSSQDAHTQLRLLLMTYCQILESSYLYHIIYNLLSCIKGDEPPKVFNFLEFYRAGVPPSVWRKVEEISSLSKVADEEKVGKILIEIFDQPIRNAVSHADYILFKDEFRLKHRGSEIKKIPIKDVALLINKTISFVDLFFNLIQQHKTSYKEGYMITGRKSKLGYNLSSMKLSVHPQYGVYGFSTVDPLPMW